jgi:CheY-like chemotaxis protein
MPFRTQQRFKPTHHPANGKPLILCVEDNELYLRLRRAVLERNGYAVIGVTNAADAISTLREAPICCTIADHMLQGERGTDFLRAMKEIKPDIPVILFSGTAPEGLQNVDVYINKGEPTSTFLRIVRDVIERYCS